MKIFKITVLILSVFSVFSAKTQERKPLDAFVKREMENGHALKVKLWSQVSEDNSFDVSNSVKNAQFFKIDQQELNNLLDLEANIIQLEVAYGAQNLTLNLIRYDIFSSDFSVNLINEKTENKFNYTPGLYYRGVIEGMEGSLAAFSFFNNEVYGIFSIPTIGNINLIPIKNEESDIQPHYVMYNESNLLLESPGCKTDELPLLSKLSDDKQIARSAYEDCKTVEVYIAVDYETYKKKNFNQTTTANYITSIFNGVTTLFRNEGVYMSMKHMDINTSPDEYQNLPTNSIDYLLKFGEVTQNNFYEADVAHLVSSSNGNMGGVAWLNVMCDSYQTYGGNHFGPYAFSNINANETMNDFPTFSWNIQVMTHEIGHNIGSQHTQWCGWPGGAIDGCWDLEYGNGVASCSMPVPQYPVNGGTIMSYCHMQFNVGINFSNGFGPFPGAVIREKVGSSACSQNYTPNTALSSSNTLINANRECTDQAGMTYYWNDNNTADETDDILVLKIRKEDNDIGNLDDNNFNVTMETFTGYNSNQGIPILLDPQLPHIENTNFAMNRFWSINPVNQPSDAIQIYFPFVQQDINDLKGSVPSVDDYQQLLMYSAKNQLDPNPENGINAADSANISIYTYSNNPNEKRWAFSDHENSLFATFKTNYLKGGSGFVTTSEISSIAAKPTDNTFSLYPNPAKNEINIVLAKSNTVKTPFSISDISGKIVYSGFINGNKTKVNISEFSSGVYTLQVSINQLNHGQNFVIK